jgi:hypothetical protein
MLPRPALLLGVLLSGAACTSVAGGDREATAEDCATLCVLQHGAEGCSGSAEACSAACVADTDAFSEDCLVKARAYYQCAALLSWSCPTAPDRPENADSRCDAARHDLLVCTVTGL